VLTTESREYAKDGCTLWGGEHISLIWLSNSLHRAGCHSVHFLIGVWYDGLYLNDMHSSDWMCWQSKDAGIRTLVMLDEQGGNVEMWCSKLCIYLVLQFVSTENSRLFCTDTVRSFWKLNSYLQLITVITACQLHVFSVSEIRSYSL